jgi:4a-hydroxytetrahydrobiopterin dehydratase
LSRPARLERDVIESWITAHPKWRVEDAHLVREFVTSDYPSGARLIQAQVSLAEGLDHHPNVTFGYRNVRFDLWTHDQHGLTRLDLDYAEGLEALVADEFADLV